MVEDKVESRSRGGERENREKTERSRSSQGCRGKSGCSEGLVEGLGDTDKTRKREMSDVELHAHEDAQRGEEVGEDQKKR